MFSGFEGQETQETHVDNFGPSGAKYTPRTYAPLKGGTFQKDSQSSSSHYFSGAVRSFSRVVAPWKIKMDPPKNVGK